MRKQTVISIALFVLCCLTKNKLFACKCFFQTFQVESDNADLIFKGVVLDKKDSIAIGKVFYTFRATKIWKGIASQNITVETNYGGPACGASFDINKEYVIFSSNLQTSKCRRNSVVSICADVARLDYKYVTSFRQNIAIDTFPILSKSESDYFNIITKSGIYIHGENASTINFTDTKIAFLDIGLISKKEYFKRYGDKDIAMHFEKFSEREIKESGGYYGVLCVHKKMSLTKRQKKNLISQLL